jgi:hypothetical protein
LIGSGGGFQHRHREAAFAALAIQEQRTQTSGLLRRAPRLAMTAKETFNRIWDDWRQTGRPDLA